MPPNNNPAIARYKTTYRADEISLIINLARRGESLGLMGIAGVGKSNIVNFLRNVQQNIPEQTKQTVEQLHFPIVDATRWQGDANDLWRIMLDALNQATSNLPAAADENKVIPISENERTLKALHVRLRQVCQEFGHQVMFVLDDFDAVLGTGPLSMLEELNGLRSDGNREFLSYLVFTKRLPHILGYRHNLENRSKFYDLFRHNIYALEPYIQDDALRMLQHLNEVARNPLSNDDLKQIYHIAGGHAGLLRIVFKIWAEEGASGVKAAYFTNKPGVQQECRRILNHLHQQEQKVALLAAQGSLRAEHQDTLKHLMRRGLLTKLEPPTWFSLLMAQFLKTYKA